MKHFVPALVLLLAGCGAADNDESLWNSNPVGGGDAFSNVGSQTNPTATGTGTSAPTNTNTVGPVSTGTSMPTSTGTGTSTFPTTTATTTTTTTSFPTTTGTTTSTSTSTGTVDTPLTGNSGPCSLELDFTTVSYNGWFAPAHVEAAWVEDAAGTYIHTLEEYGQIRQQNLVTWNQKSGGLAVDAVTGATIQQHRAHTVTWDCIDLQNNPVPDGNYRVIAEFTEDDSAGFFGPPTKLLQVDFVKSAQPGDVTVPDSATYRAVHLTYR